MGATLTSQSVTYLFDEPPMAGVELGSFGLARCSGFLLDFFDGLHANQSLLVMAASRSQRTVAVDAGHMSRESSGRLVGA